MWDNFSSTLIVGSWTPYLNVGTVVTVHSNDHTEFSTLSLVLKPLLTKSGTVAYSNQSDSSFYFSSAGYRKKEAI